MSRRNFIIGSTINDLTRDLLYWWDLDAGGATITDQHSGLVLTRETIGAGSGITSVGTAPDGGNSILFGPLAANGARFFNNTVPKPVNYNTAFTVNIWALDSSQNTIGNWRINHRGTPPTAMYWQVASNVAASENRHFLWHNGGANTPLNASFALPALNTWTMYTFVRRGSTLEQWQNGVLVASAAIPAGTMDTGNAPYAIGGQAWGMSVGSQLAHLGELWCAGQWNRAITPTEIASLYNGGTGRKYAAL